MSEQNSKQGEAKCWGETSTTIQPDASSLCPIEDIKAFLEAPIKPQWRRGLDVGFFTTTIVVKKDSWDRTTRGVTLTWCIQKPGRKLELEAQSNQEELAKELLKEDQLKRHITQIVMGTLENLNI